MTLLHELLTFLLPLNLLHIKKFLMTPGQGHLVENRLGVVNISGPKPEKGDTFEKFGTVYSRNKGHGIIVMKQAKKNDKPNTNRERTGKLDF